VKEKKTVEQWIRKERWRKREGTTRKIRREKEGDRKR
jgi:hypothetical protein